jgi:hypothetical protein
MLGGGRMTVDLDEAKGRAVGSHIRLSGRVFGASVYLDEVVTRRDPGSASQQGMGDRRRAQVARHRRVLDPAPRLQDSFDLGTSTIG